MIDSTDAQVELLIESGAVVDVPKHVSKEKNADVLGVARHHTSGVMDRLRNTAYAIIREAPCPVVSVRRYRLTRSIK